MTDTDTPRDDAKHTPGQLARNIHPITKYPTLYAGRNSHVAVVVTSGGISAEEAEANAERLILCWNAHDDLVAALCEAKELIHGWHGPAAWEIYDEHSPEMKRINSAIAKATGRNQ